MAKTKGMNPDVGIGHIRIHGTKDVDITDFYIGGDLNRRIDQADTLTLRFTDVDRKLIRSNIFNKETVINFDGLPFTLAQVSKNEDELLVVFEGSGVADLRRKKGKMKVGPNKISRTEFARRLVEEVKYLKFEGESTVETRKAIMRGGKDNPGEDSWECLQRLASERDWRCFETENVVYFGSDAWLLNQYRTPHVVTEDSQSVDVINFEYDSGKRAETATLQVWAQLWAARPGASVIVEELGRLCAGKWLVEGISRSLDSQIAQVNLVRKTRALPEPKNDSGGGAVIAVGGIIGVGNAIEKLGFVVSEHPSFGGVTGQCRNDPHTFGSYHCKNLAIDINYYGGKRWATENEAMQWLFEVWIPENVIGIAEDLWWKNDAGHRDHGHLALTPNGGLKTYKVQNQGQYPGVSAHNFDKPIPIKNASSLSQAERIRRKILYVFGSSDGKKAIQVATCESGLNPKASNVNTNRSVDRGIFQINSIHRGTLYPSHEEPRLYEEDYNIWVAKKLRDRDGWDPWVCAVKLGVA